MKYNININQKAIIDNWFNLDIIDCAILNYIQDFAKSNKIIKIIYDWQEYFWIQYEHFIKEMPLLWIKNKQALKRRIDKIVECWILEKHLLNWNSTYFKFWDNYEKLISDEAVWDDEGLVWKVEGGEYDNTRGGSMKSWSIKHNTNNNNTNNNNLSKDKGASSWDETFLENKKNLIWKFTNLKNEEEEKEKKVPVKKEKEEYWNPEVNEVINIIKKHNNRLCAGTQKEQRRYWKLLINKLEEFTKDWYDKFQALDIMIDKVKDNQYHNTKIVWPKEIYYNFEKLIQIIKGEVKKEKKRQIVEF